MDRRVAAVNHSIYSADRTTHLKIVVVGLLCAVLLLGVVSKFASLNDIDLGTAPLVKVGQPVAVSGHLPAIR